MNKPDTHMPGCWICDKCGFILQKSTIHALSGAISADDSPLNETCPNDGVLMRPYTWREANEGYSKANAELRDELERVQKQAAAMREALERIPCPNYGAQISYGATEQDPMPKACGWCDVCAAQKALSTGTGQGYVSKDQVRPLVEAVRTYLLEHGPEVGCSMCKAGMQAALADAQAMGFE